MKIDIIKGENISDSHILVNSKFYDEFNKKLNQIENKQFDKLNKKNIYLYFPIGAKGLSKLFIYNNNFKKTMSPDKADYIIFPTYYKTNWLPPFKIYSDINGNLYKFSSGEHKKNIIKDNIYYYVPQKYTYNSIVLHDNYKELFFNINSYDEKLCTLSKLLYMYTGDDKGDLNTINYIVENYDYTDLLERLTKELFTKNYNNFKFSLCKYLCDNKKLSYTLFDGCNNGFKTLLKEYFNISDIKYKPSYNVLFKKNKIFLNNNSKEDIKKIINDELIKNINNFIESNILALPLEINYNLETDIKWSI